jgi:membrane fusion protein (multidrug efflux system)
MDDTRIPIGADAAPVSSAPPPAAPAKTGRKILIRVIILLIVAGLIVAGWKYWQYSSQFATTDDAFIDGHISQVSTQVAGRVTAIAISDNEKVKAGQLLLQLDPRNFQQQVDQARAQRAQAVAQLDQARAQVGVLQANIDQAEANVRVTQADFIQAQADFARYRAVDPKAITRQQIDNANAALRSAQAKLDANREAAAAARAQLTAQNAQIEAADANVKIADVAIANAELQLSYTKVTAPQDGQVTKRTVELGNYVVPGQSLLAVVAPQMWVTANFKETQLAAMHPGQDVTVTVDACPDLKLHARIDSFQAGSGNAFSALPAENATGNYVKVVQRVPVKIVFDDAQVSDCHMAPGMSVAPAVTLH